MLVVCNSECEFGRGARGADTYWFRVLMLGVEDLLLGAEGFHFVAMLWFYGFVAWG